MYVINKIREDFPILNKKIKNNIFIYLDNAASTQKPNIVIDAEIDYYLNKYAAIHRGIHTLSSLATFNIENIRKKISKFINANYKEIIFVKSATSAINLIAYSFYIKKNIKTIIISEMEHHANIIPWQRISKEKKIKLLILPLLPNGKLNIEKLSKILNKKIILISITQVSNVIGTINPIKIFIRIIREKSYSLILIDGAQGILYNKINIKKINCDFYVFSAHKMYASSGIGIMYGKKKYIKYMPPWELGGAIIKNLSIKKGTEFINFPWKFETGNLHSAGIIGLGAALDYIKNIINIYYYEKKNIQYILKSMYKMHKINLYGQNIRKGIISFNILKYHSYDIGSLLDSYGISIRTGNLCAIPLMNYFKVKSMCRISLGIYNNIKDIYIFILKLKAIIKIL